MKLYKSVALCLFLAVLVASSAAWCAVPTRDGDPQTIAWAIRQGDGTCLTLTGEQVARIGHSRKSFAIRECGTRETTPERFIVVSTSRFDGLESFMSVDVTGTLRTVASRTGGTQRVLVTRPSDVLVACSSNGRPVIFLPWKMSGVDWPYKRPLTEFAGSAISLMDAELPPMPDIEDEEPSPSAAGSRDSLKWLPDGAPVSVNGAVVSASFSDYGFFYVEKSDRSFGIWVNASYYAYDGDLLDITGTMATGGGERVVVANQGGVNWLGYGYPRPDEVGLPNKMLGGGPVGMFTPAVADASGLNNTGLLVRAWGRVTYVDSQYPIFYIDDGSNVAADAEQAGVKVYDLTYDPLPSVNDYVTLSGVSAAEWPEGSETSIRVLYKTASVSPSTQSGTGTISGTISATGADGKTVRVYCASASTTATFSGDTANYSLSVPCGDHAVTTSLLGYKTTTQLATVSSGTPVDLDFTLTTIYKLIDVVPFEPRIAPDGVSETVVTAIARDEEGRRIGNESITWGVDFGTLVDSESSTNAVGEATATIRSSTNHETATIAATVGSLVGYGWVQYASANDPSVFPVSPYMNQVLSGGNVEVRYWVSAADGTTGLLESLEVYVDGVFAGEPEPNDPTYYWDTFAEANGWHTLRAKLTDIDGNWIYSPITHVYTDNLIYSATVTPDEINPSLGQQASIHALLKQPCNWEATIRNSSGSTVVYTTSGSGSEVNATWDGSTALDEDLFQCKILATAISGGQSCTTSERWVGKTTVPDSQVQVLAVAGPNLPPTWPLRISPIYTYARARGFAAKKLYPKTATWTRVSSILSNGVCRFLHISSHGGFQLRYAVPSMTPTWRTHFLLKGTTGVPGRVFSYPIQGWNNKAVSELGLEDSTQMRGVFIDACKSGASGVSSGENDMAKAFGMYNYYNMQWGEQSYVGWKGLITGDLDYCDYIMELYYYWHTSGRTLERAEWLAYFTDTSRFQYIYGTNLANYGGWDNIAYWTTFFEVY